MFELNEEALPSHTTLEKAITSAPMLLLPRKTETYVIEADASPSQLGAQLLQEQEDKAYKPIGFCSRPCTAADRKYCSTERESIAIVWRVKLCRPYLERTKFIV
jgi:RNase H-like domain found in reverse transcriptase